MDLQDTAIDIEKERDGVWIEIDKTTSVMLARYLNPKHKKCVSKLMKPYARLQRMNNLSDEITDKIEAQAIAETILLGWKGLKENGADVLYSKEKAIEIMMDPKYSAFADLVKELSSDMENFHQILIEESVENLGESLHGG